MGSKLYSRDLQLKVARANRLIQAERERQITIETLGEIIGESYKGDKVKWGKTALEFAEKEIKKIFGPEAEKFTLKGATEAQIRKTEAAVERVLDSVMLTKKGRAEQERRNTANFYRKDVSEVTQADMDFLKKLDDTGLLDKLKELGYKYAHIIEALNTAIVHKKEGRALTTDEKIDIVRQIVSHAEENEEKHKENGVFDYYGILGEFINENISY